MKGLRRWRFEVGGKKTQGSRLKAQSYKQEGWYAGMLESLKAKQKVKIDRHSKCRGSVRDLVSQSS